MASPYEKRTPTRPSLSVHTINTHQISLCIDEPCNESLFCTYASLSDVSMTTTFLNEIQGLFDILDSKDSMDTQAIFIVRVSVPDNLGFVHHAEASIYSATFEKEIGFFDALNWRRVASLHTLLAEHDRVEVASTDRICYWDPGCNAWLYMLEC